MGILTRLVRGCWINNEIFGGLGSQGIAMTDDKIDFEKLFCPVCGFYCYGNGGLGCIDKKGLYEMTDNDKPEFFGGRPLPNERKIAFWEGFVMGIGIGAVGVIVLLLVAKAVIDAVW